MTTLKMRRYAKKIFWRIFSSRSKRAAARIVRREKRAKLLAYAKAVAEYDFTTFILFPMQMAMLNAQCSILHHKAEMAANARRQEERRRENEMWAKLLNAQISAPPPPAAG